METPLSTYVRDKIKKLPFTEENREYVRELLTIEEHVTHGPSSRWSAMIDVQLRSEYPAEYDAIFRELNPTGYIRDKRERARRHREERADEAREAAELRRERERDRKMWIRVGGHAPSR